MDQHDARDEQLAYSDLQYKMLDEEVRRKKAAKILSVVRHALGREDLTGLVALDVGCSAGFIAHELALSGATTIGVDIDAPGIEKAKARFGDTVDFRLSSGDHIPLDDESVDLIVFNHIYEHVVSPEAVVADMRRVLKPGGLAYLGLGNRLGIIEPHYELPFLSWLPRRAADSYMRVTGKGNQYYEQFRYRSELRRLFKDFDVWDYTLPILAEPEQFANTSRASTLVERVPEPVLAGLMPLIPTYIWAAFKEPTAPKGAALRVAPKPLSRRS